MCFWYHVKKATAFWRTHSHVSHLHRQACPWYWQRWEARTFGITGCGGRWSQMVSTSTLHSYYIPLLLFKSRKHQDKKQWKLFLKVRQNGVASIWCPAIVTWWNCKLGGNTILFFWVTIYYYKNIVRKVNSKANVYSVSQTFQSPSPS